MTNTPISDATPHNVGDLGMLCRKLERDLRKCEAGAAAMQEALEMCKRLPIARSYPDGPCLDRVDHEEVCAALATNAGRDLLEEVERLRFGCDQVAQVAFERDEAVRENLNLRRKVAAAEGMAEALQCISKCENAPDVDVTGEWETGLHCGVEDRNCRTPYEGANYGHTVGVEKALEWASNEAKHALAAWQEAERLM